jgi:predicted deacylase
MPEPTPSDAAHPNTTEEQAIRERVKGLTTQVLQQGRMDPEAVRDVVRAVIGGAPSSMAVGGAEARELFADEVKKLDEALANSASATHEALQRLATRGKDFTDNDLKEALVHLRQLEQDYAVAASRIVEAMSGNLRREMMELAVHAQNIGVEASARVASMMGEFAEGVGVTPGMAKIRDAGVRMALLASGVLAGVADALRDQPEAKDGS